METILLEAQIRDGKVSPLFLRKNHKIPAVYYGSGEKNMSLQLDYQSFRKVYMKAGTNQIVQLSVDGKKKPVLIQEVQHNPLSDNYDHVDFIHINMNEEVTTMIPLEFIGISSAVKDLGGVLTTLKDEIEVTCLPTHLPQSIQVDISGLTELHSSIHVKDIVVSKEVKITEDLEEVVVSVTPPRAEEESTSSETVTAEAASAATAPAEEKKE